MRAGDAARRQLPTAWRETRAPTTSAGQSPEGRAQAEDLLSHVDQPQNGFNPFDDVPVVGDALRALFGTTTTASEHIDVQSPWMAGAKLSEGGGLTVACNEHPHDVLDVAKGILTKHLPATVKP